MVSRKYVDDYRLENITDGKGKLKTVPVYRGPRFRFAADGETLRRAKRRCAALVALATAALLVPLLLNAELMRRWYAALPLALGVLPLAELWMGLRRLFTAGETVTREHRDKLGPRLTGWSLVLAILAGLSLAGQFAAYLSGCGADGIPVTVCTAALLASAAGLFAGRDALRTEQVPEDTENEVIPKRDN